MIRGREIPLPKGETVRGWSRSSVARGVAKWLREEPIEQALSVLLLACEGTTDIKVAKAYSELKILASFATTFEQKDEEEET